MSTDWAYRFRAPLREELRGLGLPGILGMAPARLRDVDFPSHPPDPDRLGVPGLGPFASYDTSRFEGIEGISTDDGEIRLGICTQNLGREPFEDDEGLTQDAEGTRLDLLLSFLAWATIGAAGQVVGCIAHEGTEYGHAHPLVRCADGRIRVAVTEPRPHAGHWIWMHDTPEEALVPEVIPCDLIRVTHGSWAEIDCDGLHGRFLPLDATPVSPCG